MSSNLNSFRQLNVTKNCSNLTQIAPANTSDTLHHTYHNWKKDANVEYLHRVKMALSSHVGGINITDTVNIRKAHEETNDSGYN